MAGAGGARSQDFINGRPQRDVSLFSTSAGDDASASNALTDEIERLQGQLQLIEAIEERNRAQLGSFLDEEDQWESLEPEERDLLNSKVSCEEKLEQLTSEMVDIWMTGKSLQG